MATATVGKRKRIQRDPTDVPLPTSIRLSRTQRKLIGRAAVEVEESRQDFMVGAIMDRVDKVLDRTSR